MKKVAMPTRGGMVDEHFGHCEAFTLFTVDDSGMIVDQEMFTPPPACGCKSNLIPTLSSMGYGVVIAGNMGEGAAMNLRRQGFTVVRGAKGPVRQALEAWLAGALKDHDELCTSHGHHGHDGCGHTCQHEALEAKKL